MELATPTASTGQKLIANKPGQDGFIVATKADSAASLRILTGLSFDVDGAEAGDTTGIVLEADRSIELPAGAYVCKTADNGTAATFDAIAFIRRK